MDAIGPVGTARGIHVAEVCEAGRHCEVRSERRQPAPSFGSWLRLGRANSEALSRHLVPIEIRTNVHHHRSDHYLKDQSCGDINTRRALDHTQSTPEFKIAYRTQSDLQHASRLEESPIH